MRVIDRCIVHAAMLLCCVAVTIVLSGCSGGNNRQALHGSVTLDGQPLASGSISFQPIAGTEGPSAGGSIQDGKFSIAKSDGLLPGNYAVTIQSFRATGRMKKEGSVEIPETLPLRFRAENSLEATITSSADNEFEYRLTTTTQR